ncbi:hypothetical protein [Fodinicola feengrottensis]|uniref:Uncharacterized protein n=1 Tax=Fodinicola feengrottensis TaxID=435914 RepID=A0ABN2G1T5_9ACTN|nr:hypothetical protein [Fodinicola feengrottensis]
MPARYLDVDPDAVGTAGRTTASTSTDWESWASHVDGQLRGAAEQASDPVVTPAFEDHLCTWNPRIQSMARNVDALGTNAVSASNVVANADSTSTTTLTTTGAAAHGLSSVLSRPIAQ